MSHLPTDNRNPSNTVSKYYNKIAAFIHRRVRSWEDGEDILQNVFYHLARTDQLALPVDLVLPLLFRVARNAIIDFWRKRKGVLFSEIEDEETEEILSLLLSDEDEQPEWVDLQNLLWDKFRQALNELPPEQREIFEQTERQGESFREISERTGVNINTLLSRKRYAVQYLRESLREVRDLIMD
ncbi:MAG: RNA polymerase sigma factor [Planctomycetaceae bacterium]|jgi:RNA polymerase sigma factor (sigma-70 family)|nr:RNA polymerase sigma factor [Planctomycetaceae bacterium]